MWRVLIVSWMVLTAVLWSSCGSSGSGEAVGTVGEPCYPNSTCNLGLTCEEGVCVQVASGLDGDSEQLRDVRDVNDADDGLSCIDDV